MAIEDTRERLLTTAGQIFAEKGYQDATVREICQAAEVNLAAVNYHFGDKERLYIEAVKRAHCMRSDEVPLPQWPVGTPAIEKLHGFILTILTRMVDDPSPPWSMQLMMRELFRPTAACAELVQDFIRPHFQILLSILDELLPADMPQHERNLIGFSVIGQCLHYKVARPVVAILVGEEELASYTPLRLAQHITHFTLAAIALPNAGRPTLNPVGIAKEIL